MKTQAARFAILGLLLLAAFLIVPGNACASGESGSKWGIWFTIGRFFNLGIVIWVLVWVARKPLTNFYASRTQSIHEQLAEAQKARQEAEAKLHEVEARMSRLDDELRQVRAAAEREADEEHRRLLEETERDAGKIVERARQEIEGAMRAARLELKAHAAELSVRLAEERIQGEITAEDRNRLFDRFIAQLGGEK
jgi:F-type H+-transporting ATPase subunit b